MKLGGYQKITLMDYPGKLSAICFTQGCQLRCPYCHNPELVLPEKFISHSKPMSAAKDFFSYISERKNMLDAIVFSGGEPLLQDDLQEVLDGLKTQGFLIKLDTNGLLPDRLEKLIKEGLIDYVALDYKANSLAWSRATGIESIPAGKDLFLKWIKSLEVLDRSPIPYQLRTTVVKELHSKENLILMGEELNSLIKKSNPKWFLQGFEKSQNILQDYQEKSMELSPYSKAEMIQIKDIIKSIIPIVELRN